MGEQITNGGIYLLTNFLSGESYLGSTTDFTRRWLRHRRDLRRLRHANQHLQAAWNKYGENAFLFVIVETVSSRNCLVETEQHWLDKLKPAYNIVKVVASPFLGRRHTCETKAILSASKSGPNHPMWGKHLPATTRKKLSLARTGERNHNFGKQLSSGQRKKLSTIKLSANNPWRGKRHSQSTRNKISEAHKGRKKSAAHKEKLRAATIAYHAKIKALQETTFENR